LTQRKTADGRSELAGVAGRAAAAVVVLFGALGLVAGCGEGGGGSSGDGDAGGLSCSFDESTGPGEAFDLDVGAPREEFICPRGDEDWYAFSVERERAILEVSLGMKSELTNVAPTYVIHEVGEGGELGDPVARPGGSGGDREVLSEHCLDGGDYKLVVRDRGNDDTDARHAYELALSAAENPDDDEPNDSREEAIELQESRAKSGFIACQGDVDWYAFDVPEDRIFRLDLTADKPDYQPKMAVYRGESGENPLAEVENPASPREATSLSRFVVAPEGGRHFVAVSDDDGSDADASVPYEIRFELIEDADGNEPNDSPEEATRPQSSVECGDSWTTVVDSQGTIGAPGDDDWFEIPVADCEQGILEATMEIETTGLPTEERWSINEQVQSSLTMVRPDTKSSCGEDSECRVLEGRDCTEDIDCSGFFESCTNQGKCAGAAQCLPGGNCGGIQVERSFECDENFETCDPDSGEDPPPNRATFAAPVLADDVVYLRAGDFQGDGAAPERIYSLTVRLREDPDDTEPNDLFVNSPERGFSPSQHRRRAEEIPVYDCAQPTQTQQGTVGSDAGDVGDVAATDTDGDGVADASMDTAKRDTGSGDPSDAGGGDSDDLPDGCCSNREWVEGSVSYQNDRDWFEYRHPCPGEDCTIRVHYEVDGGPVDVAMNVYQDGGNRPWLSAYEVGERERQNPRSGAFGGLTMQDRCAYAFQGHTAGEGDTYDYGINVSDEVESTRREGITVTNQGSRDWSPGQTYRLCVEKISDECAEPPCEEFENGCGPPQ